MKNVNVATAFAILGALSVKACEFEFRGMPVELASSCARKFVSCREFKECGEAYRRGKDYVNDILNWDALESEGLDPVIKNQPLTFDDVCCSGRDEMDCPDIQPVKWNHCYHHEDLICEYGEVECGFGEIFPAVKYECLRNRWMVSTLDCSNPPDAESGDDSPTTTQSRCERKRPRQCKQIDGCRWTGKTCTDMVPPSTSPDFEGNPTIDVLGDATNDGELAAPVPSIKDCVVTMYDKKNFKGETRKKYIGKHNLDSFASRTTSMKVEGLGCVVEAFSDRLYRGKHKTFKEGDYNKQDMAAAGMPTNRLSSLIVCKGVCEEA